MPSSFGHLYSSLWKTPVDCGDRLKWLSDSTGLEQQLTLSCESEWMPTFSTVHKAHTRTFPVFSVSKARWHSEGHLAVLFYIFFHHKSTVLLCSVVLWWALLTRTRWEAVVPHSYGYLLKLFRNCECQAHICFKRHLTSYTFSLRRNSLPDCRNVMIEETLCSSQF